MTLRSATRWVVIGCAVLLAVPCVFFGLWFAAAASNNSGSPVLAAEWRDHLAQFSDPDTARATDPAVIVLRFPNGEWAFGRSQDSHGVWRRGGGTIVVKDSSGRTRAYFGHVCGGGHLGCDRREELPNLAEYHKAMASRFVEHPLE